MRYAGENEPRSNPSGTELTTSSSTRKEGKANIETPQDFPATLATAIILYIVP